jgi:hypothetical protein
MLKYISLQVYPIMEYLTDEKEVSNLLKNYFKYKLNEYKIDHFLYEE